MCASMPPFQGFTGSVRYSQGVALGFIIAAFQAGDPAATFLLCEFGNDGANNLLPENKRQWAPTAVLTWSIISR